MCLRGVVYVTLYRPLLSGRKSKEDLVKLLVIILWSLEVRCKVARPGIRNFLGSPGRFGDSTDSLLWLGLSLCRLGRLAWFLLAVLKGRGSPAHMFRQ